MCDHNGQLTIYSEFLHDDDTVRVEYGHCPDCDARMFERRVYTQSGEVIYGDVDPAWHGKTVLQATEQIQELMAVVADNARKRSELEAEYREMTNRAIQAQKAAEDTAINRLALLTSMRIRMVEIATDLARAGNFDHKGKNEAILRMIASLLAMCQWKSAKEPASAREMDDLPF